MQMTVCHNMSYSVFLSVCMYCIVMTMYWLATYLANKIDTKSQIIWYKASRQLTFIQPAKGLIPGSTLIILLLNLSCLFTRVPLR